MNETTINLGKQVLHEDDLRIKVEYKGETFTMRYPNPAQISMIEADIARRLGGLPRTSYDIEHLNRVTACCYVEALYDPKGCPAWFDGAWTCYDEILIVELYAGYLRFRDFFREKLRKGGLS